MCKLRHDRGCRFKGPSFRPPNDAPAPRPAPPFQHVNLCSASQQAPARGSSPLSQECFLSLFFTWARARGYFLLPRSSSHPKTKTNQSQDTKAFKARNASRASLPRHPSSNHSHALSQHGRRRRLCAPPAARLLVRAALHRPLPQGSQCHLLPPLRRLDDPSVLPRRAHGLGQDPHPGLHMVCDLHNGVLDPRPGQPAPRLWPAPPCQPRGRGHRYHGRRQRARPAHRRGLRYARRLGGGAGREGDGERRGPGRHFLQV